MLLIQSVHKSNTMMNGLMKVNFVSNPVPRRHYRVKVSQNKANISQVPKNTEDTLPAALVLIVFSFNC